VCQKCEQRFPENLTAIIDAWEDLHRQVSRSSSFELRERVTGTADVGLVLNETVMDIMAEVRDWAIFVSRVISTERTGSGHPQSIDTPGLLKFVRVNAEWALEHELAGEFVNDSGFLKSLVHNTAYPSGARRLNLPKGRCTQEGCESGVVAILRPAGGKPSNVQCKADPKHVVDMTQSLNQEFVEWLKNDEEYKRQVNEISEIQLDFVENKLIDRINKGDTTAIIFYLNSKGKARGYNRQHEEKRENVKWPSNFTFNIVKNDEEV